MKKPKVHSSKEIIKGFNRSLKKSLSSTKEKHNKAKVIFGINNALNEVKQAHHGKIKLKTLKEIINELNIS